MNNIRYILYETDLNVLIEMIEDGLMKPKDIVSDEITIPKEYVEFSLARIVTKNDPTDGFTPEELMNYDVFIVFNKKILKNIEKFDVLVLLPGEPLQIINSEDFPLTSKEFKDAIYIIDSQESEKRDLNISLYTYDMDVRKYIDEIYLMFAPDLFEIPNVDFTLLKRPLEEFIKNIKGKEDRDKLVRLYNNYQYLMKEFKSVLGKHVRIHCVNINENFEPVKYSD